MKRNIDDIYEVLVSIKDFLSIFMFVLGVVIGIYLGNQIGQIIFRS